MDDIIEQKVKAQLVDGKLPCAMAFKIAAELNIEPPSIKDTADKLGIKISACQLGCFP